MPRRSGELDACRVRAGQRAGRRPGDFGPDAAVDGGTADGEMNGTGEVPDADAADDLPHVPMARVIPPHASRFSQ